MRLLSIDPGTNFTGFSVLEINPPTDKKPVTVLHCESVNIEIVANSYFAETIIPHHGLRQAKVMAVGLIVSEFLKTWEPDVVVCESPYMGRFPQAFSALVECLSSIKQSVIDYRYNLPFISYDPSTVKKAVGSTKINSDKDKVRVAVQQLFPELNLTYLDEHAVDSIAVGYTHYVQWKEQLFRFTQGKKK